MPSSDLIAIAQLNPVVGDLSGNAAQILQAAQTAQAQGATLLLTAELSLTGYTPQDLLLRPDFLSACAEALQQLAQDLHTAAPGIQVLVGHPSGASADAQGHCAAALKDNPKAAVLLVPNAPHTLLNLPAARHAVAGFLAPFLRP